MKARSETFKKGKEAQGTETAGTIQNNLRPNTTLYLGVSPYEDLEDSFRAKQEGVVQLAGENINMFNTSNFNNQKGNELCQFLWIFEVNGFFGQEAGINWDLMPWSGKLEAMFHMENALEEVVGHNKHRKTSRGHYSGTFMLAFGGLAMKKLEMSVDKTGLGRWVWMKYTG